MNLFFFFEHDSENFSKHMSHRLELFFFWKKKLNDSKNWFYLLKNRLKELNFFKKESKNCTFFQYDSKNWTLFLNMFQWIEPFAFRCDSKSWTLFLIWLKELNIFQCDPKNWTFFECDSKNWTFFFNMTQKNCHL